MTIEADKRRKKVTKGDKGEKKVTIEADKQTKTSSIKSQ